MAKKNESKQSFFIPLMLLLAGVSALFLVLSPKVSAIVFPFTQNHRFQSFKNELVKQKYVNPQKYWEFREFYSPGDYTFQKSGFSQNEIAQFSKEHQIPTLKNTSRSFLFFTSTKFASIDSLTDKKSLSEVLEPDIAKDRDIILQTDKTLLFKDKKNEYVLISLFNLVQMKKANGFFNYQKDDEIYKGKNWISVSRIK